MAAAESADGRRPVSTLPRSMHLASSSPRHLKRAQATSSTPANSAPTAIARDSLVPMAGAKSAASLLDKPGQVSNKDFRLIQSGNPDEAVHQSALRSTRS